jgi:hypothetical protein
MLVMGRDTKSSATGGGLAATGRSSAARVVDLGATAHFDMLTVRRTDTKSSATGVGLAATGRSSAARVYDHVCVYVYDLGTGADRCSR